MKPRGSASQGGRPTCIVWGRAIRKRTTDIAVQPVSPGAIGGWHHDAHVHADLRSKADCQRHTNQQVVHIVRGSDGFVHRFSVWDGTYHDDFFCTNTCAMKQGYASARHGDRFSWKARVE